ncbi:uncharacterized protein IL334_001452 [Kwoniella shivajii]|uniref:Histone chaperone domain-containing protein n=1 Tax=Kwoniella shivajii TaxID=564305 RepID=A0ABZ1CTI6_9TREE|nr:hypothetical protein IL334_001452 [Kwoniella shivajii]
MDESLLPALRRETVRTVNKASKPGGAIDNGTFTMKSARSEIESSMKLQSGSLSGEWKNTVKELVQEAIDNLDQGHSPQTKASGSELKSKLSSKNGKGTEKKKGKRKEKQRSPDSPQNESSDEEEKEDIVSDDEAGLSTPQAKRKSSSSKGKSSARKSIHSEEEIPMMDKREEEPQARLDDSDMSSVYDEPPTTKSRQKIKSTSSSTKKTASGNGKRKSKSVSAISSDDDAPKKSVKRKKKDPNEGLSPEEAKLADLKRIVVACGIRKQWAKEFAEYPTTSSQIRHLQSILTSLGIRGAPTMGKAKSIKEKRDLAQELDDVQSFEAARGVSSETTERRTRGTSSKSKRKTIISDEESDAIPVSEDSEEGELDKEHSALGAIMDLDFLGGDSDTD